MDYDNARHNLDVQQNAKKKDEVKITKVSGYLNISLQFVVQQPTVTADIIE